MALLNIGIGLSFGRGVINSVVGDLKQVISSANAASKAVDDIGKKNDILKTFQGFASIGTVGLNAANSIKLLGSEIKSTVSFFSGYAAQGDKIAKTSRMVGLSVKEYQAFSSAANHAGMSTEEMDRSLQRFNINLGKAKSGDAKSLKMFDALLGGKSVSDFKDSSSLLAAVADGYTKLGSAETKAFVSHELFGKSGLKMSELFKDGGESLKKYVDAYDKGFSENGAKDAEAFDDALQDLMESFSGLKTSLVQDLFPAFTETFNSVREFIDSEDGKKLKDSFSGLAKSVAGSIKDALPLVPKILNVVVGLVDKIGPGVLVMVGAVVAVLPTIASILGAVGSLWTSISALVSLVGGGLLVSIGGVLILFVEIVSIVKQFYDNWDMWCSFVNHELTDAVTGFFSSIWDGIKAAGSFLYSLFIEPFVNFFAAIPDSVSDLVDGFVVGLKAVKDTVFQLGTDIYDAIVGSVTSAWNSVKGLLGNLPIIGDLFDGGGNVSNTLGSSVGQMVSSTSTTTTSRFVVDFQNMPRGTTVTPPDNGDFDYSRGYMLAGVV